MLVEPLFFPGLDNNKPSFSFVTLLCNRIISMLVEPFTCTMATCENKSHPKLLENLLITYVLEIISLEQLS